MHRNATFKHDGSHRVLLTRVWDKWKPRVLYVMFNPSRADGDSDDPTTRRLIQLSTDHGYGSFDVVNLLQFVVAYDDPDYYGGHCFPMPQQLNLLVS